MLALADADAEGDVDTLVVGVTVFVIVADELVVPVIEGLDEPVIEALIDELTVGLVEGLLEVVGVDDCVGVDV